MQQALQAQIKTQSGSTYHVFCDTGGQWWMRADNLPNPCSRRLEGGPWPILPPLPWPPHVGYPIGLLALPHLAPEDPARVPGGGKVTSPVLSYLVLD